MGQHGLRQNSKIDILVWLVFGLHISSPQKLRTKSRGHCYKNFLKQGLAIRNLASPQLFFIRTTYQ